jgi:hypothetical protein
MTMTFGELFVVGFITAAVLSASWWARAGERVALLLSKKPDASRGPTPGSDSES